MNYTAPIYNNWGKIKEVYPNKMVVAHREHASEYNNLTLTEIITALKEIQYDNVKKGNEELAYMASKYGYKQASFETLQNWYETAKLITPEEMVLKLNGENQNGEIQFKLLDKNDIEAIFIGEKTWKRLINLYFGI